MNNELKSLLILTLLTAHVGAQDTLADGPHSANRSSVNQTSASRSAAMGEYAGPERTQAAIGHYARARTLLVEAMREFDAGKEIARPDLILNSETWKAGVSARADELGHVIAPEARETTGGTRFKESHALLNQKFDKPKKFASSSPAIRRTKKSQNEKRQILVSAEKEETNSARARMTEASDPLAVKPEEKKSDKKSQKTTEAIIREPLEPVSPKVEAETSVTTTTATENDKALSELTAPVKASPIEPDLELEKAADAELSKTMGEKTVDVQSTPVEESDTAKSINDDEIRARLKKLSEEIAQEEKNKH